MAVVEGTRQGGLLRVTLLLVALGYSSALYGLDALGGTYRYGHIYWESEGNIVHYTIETAFKRNVGTTYFQGSAPDGFAQVGDIVTLTGRQTPKVYLGDTSIADVLRMKVTAYSVAEDWILGEVKITHRYNSPNDNGLPWEVQYTGCCRLSNLENNKDQEWTLTALVDLTRAKASARAKILPQISVPLSDFPVSVFLPATTPSNEEVVSWDMAKPFDVGNAAGFSAAKGSMVTVSLGPTFKSFWGFSNPCLIKFADGCGANGATTAPTIYSISPNVFFRLLRTDVNHMAITVEGWVRSDTDAGGVIFSTGRDDINSYPECTGLTGADLGMCDVSTIMVRINATHITTGHEVWDSSTSRFVLRTVSFAVCSNPELCAELSDTLKYPPLPAQEVVSTTTNKWIHVAVIRKTKYRYTTGVGITQWASTYTVFVNGKPLELSAYPGCAPVSTAEDASVTCRGQSFTFNKFGSTFTAGESNPIPGPRLVSASSTVAATARDGQCNTDGTESCNDIFATRTAMVFGSFRGASSTTRTFFTGALDEWRLWNGVRSRTEIIELMQRPLNPRLEDSYGDPTRITGTGTAANQPDTEIGATNYLTSSVLMASYNFDRMMDSVVPIYPKRPDSRMPDASKFDQAVYNGKITNVDNVPTDSSGVIFHSEVRNTMVDNSGRLTLTRRPDSPGLYQVSVMLSMPNNASVVPVDFILHVTEMSGDNAFMPELRFMPETIQVYPQSNTVYEGFAFSMDLVGSDEQARVTSPRDCTDASTGCKILSDTQVGFTLGPMPSNARFSTVRGMNPSRMTMQWTPCAANRGVSVLCFDAVDNHRNFTSSASIPSKSSEMKCVKLHVEPDPAPVLTLSHSENLHLTMGRQSTLVATASDDNCEDTLNITVGYGALLPESDEQTMGPGCKSIVRTMTFKPSYKMGGYRQNLCVSVVDGGGSCSGTQAREPVQRCVAVSVVRCRYALQMDQQLQELAGQLGMDWIRLWSLNAELLHPDNIVFSGQEIFIGHRYKVNANDRAEDVAKRMGMSMQQMWDLNYGLQQSGGMLDAGGQELCVVPNSCLGMKSTVYSDLAYRDDKFFARGAGDMLTGHAH